MCQGEGGGVSISYKKILVHRAGTSSHEVIGSGGNKSCSYTATRRSAFYHQYSVVGVGKEASIIRHNLKIWACLGESHHRISIDLVEYVGWGVGSSCLCGIVSVSSHVGPH